MAPIYPVWTATFISSQRARVWAQDRELFAPPFTGELSGASQTEGAGRSGRKLFAALTDLAPWRETQNRHPANGASHCAGPMNTHGTHLSGLDSLYPQGYWLGEGGGQSHRPPPPNTVTLCFAVLRFVSLCYVVFRPVTFIFWL